jgi:hypothetical protein
VAGNKRPSFLKKQKEQQRRARAEQKREARRARKQAKTTEGVGPDVLEAPVDMPEGGEDQDAEA